MDAKELKNRLEEITKATETLSFPLFSSLEKKKALVEKTKLRIDGEVDAAISAAGFDAAQIVLGRDALWLSADEAARHEFGDLTEKEMLNGFYLQEVMHRYAQAQVESVLLQINN